MVKDLGEVKLCKRYCASEKFVKDSGEPKLFVLSNCTTLRIFVEFGQGPWGGQALQKILCVRGNFVKDSGEPKLFVL